MASDAAWSGDLAWASIAEIQRRIATKEISPVDVVRACLTRIEALDGELRAFITVCGERALDRARAAEARIAGGEAPGPLAGVPVGLKDLCDTAGVRTTGGSAMLRDRVPDGDATLVRRLEEAGAIVVGKLNMQEFAFGAQGLNPHFGHARNPWDAGTPRIAGGSSSGSGVAVAAALCTAAIGSDTGGSIRIPAALCGITGLKPTYGRVSRAGVIPLAWTMDHLGPMARSAADCAYLLRAMAGYDPSDPTTSVLPVPEYAAALTGQVRGLRVGLLRGGFLDAAAPEIAAAVEQAAATLRSLGAVIDEVTLPGQEVVAAVSFAIVGAEALAHHGTWLRTRGSEYDPDVRRRLALGVLVSGEDYVRAQRARARLRDAVDETLRHRDVLVAPTTPIVAPRPDEAEVELRGRRVDVRTALGRLTRLFNGSGHPACALPCGRTAAGLPISLQLIGRPFDEATVLRVADAFQRETDWHTRRPPLS